MLYLIGALAISYLTMSGTAIAIWAAFMGIGIMIGEWFYIKKCIQDPNFS